jgi:hypothetical protein
VSFPNVSDIVATTLEQRSGKIADNVTKNNALLARLKAKGKVRPFSGGRVIYEELSFAENSNAGSYSGYDMLPVAAQDVLSAAEFNLKQYAVPIVVSGLEELQNAGKEAKIDLLEQRISVGESSLTNLMANHVYTDGTGNGGKNITGLDAAVPADPTTGTYGNINRASWTFWRSQLQDPASTPTASTIQTAMNTLWAALTRGADRPDLIIMDSVLWGLYMASLQTLQRFTTPGDANLGFPSIKFMDADVVLDGGIGGFATASTAYFLNTKYLHFRPHSARNMVPLKPDRVATNQDATVTMLAWAGNLTCSGAQFQGRLIGT